MYNQPNVRLIDLNADPISQFTETGVETSTEAFDFDVVIFATGFDAVTGALDRMHIQGEQGQSLKHLWQNGPQTYLGIGVSGFPNMFIAGGPHNTTSFCNIPRCIEHNVEFIAECIGHMHTKGLTRIEAEAEAQQAWTRHALDLAADTLFVKNDSWFMGANIPGKKRVFLNYVGGVPLFLEKLADVAAAGYAGFSLK